MGNSNWTNTANWTGGVAPNAIDDAANFKSSSPGGTVTLDMNQTVGTINFDLGAAYTITPMPIGNFLTMNVTSGSAAITITNTNGNGAHTIAPDLHLTKPLLVTQGSTGNFTISGAISETAANQTLTTAGSGVIVLSSGAGNSYTGGTFLNAGTVSLVSATDNQLGTGAVTIGTATLQFMNSAPLASMRNYTLVGGAIIDTAAAAANTVTLSPPSGIIGGGSLTKVGGGVLILTTANNYSGGTTVSAGQLNISNDNQLGSTSGVLNIGTATLRTTSGITSSRSGSFTGTPVTIDTAGNVDTFTGNFSGAGSLTILGGGTVSFLGINSYAGPTAVTGGTTLTGNTNGVQGSISLAAGTFLTFDQSFEGTYSGAISSTAPGNGTLTKTGTGTVHFSGTSSFSGPTNLTQGTLIVTGSLASSSLVSVSLGATLGGTGTVGPTTSSGTISPGTSIGTLTINGALILSGSSNVFIDIAPLSADRIAVTGMATINGSLTVNPTPGFYGFDACYTILTSSGLVLMPGFGPITSTNSAFIPTVTYPGTNVVLCVEILEPFAVFPFSNANTEAVGNNIDVLLAAGQLSSDLFNLFDSFAGESFDAINDALDQMHPAPYSAWTELQSEVGGELISLLHRMPYLPCSCANSNRFWLEPFGNSLTVKRHGMQIGFQGNSGGLACGYDGEISNNFIFGFGGAWNRGFLEWHDRRGHGNVNGFYGGLYSDCLIDQFYLGGAALAGVDFYEISRHIRLITTDRHTEADPIALDIMAQLAIAYLFGSPHAFFYPYANLDFLYLHTHKFQERGANGLNLTVQARTDSTLRTEIGLALQVQDTNAAETMCISPQISIGWVNLYPIERELYKATFEGATIPFTTQGWNITWNLLHVDFALSFAYRCYSLGLEYNVELSPDSETLLFNQHGNICFDWKW